MDGRRIPVERPRRQHVHVEAAVRDAADGRFVPSLKVTATLVDPNGQEVGTHEQPLIQRPMIYHYGRNWTVPTDGDYTMRVRIEPPTFRRHDEINGRRFKEPVEVEFQPVNIKCGKG